MSKMAVSLVILEGCKVILLYRSKHLLITDVIILATSHMTKPYGYLHVSGLKLNKNVKFSFSVTLATIQVLSDRMWLV